MIEKGEISTDSIFYGVPVFSPAPETSEWEYKQRVSLERNYRSYQEFIAQIRAGQSIGRVSRWESVDCPKFVIWAEPESTGKMSAIGPVTSVEYTGNNSFILRFENLYEIDLKEIENQCIYRHRHNPTVMHIPESIYDTILNRFVTHENTSLLLESSTPGEAQSEAAYSSTLSGVVTEIDPSQKNDFTLLKSFNKICEENNLFYDPKDLSNFHTAVKSGSLVILSGLSGTGKSAIVDMYAKALGLRQNSDECQYLTVPVRPAWNDDSDLLGYVDLVHMVYRASDTGFVEMLVEASQHQDKMYIVCFDEMNLARVEHYFSQFLSLLEKPEENRTLRLYDDQYNLYNASQYPSTITVRSNVRFIGTVNIDESTYHFADKVLDRANVINLHIRPFDKWERHRYTSKQLQEWTKTDYQNITKTEDNTKSTDVKRFLWDLHVVLQEESEGFGIGPRVVKCIERYLANLPTDSEEFTISVSYGLDIQVKQRVLTKLRGTAEKFGALFTKENSIISIFDKYASLSDFAESRKEIEHKQKELKIYGYCF